MPSIETWLRGLVDRVPEPRQMVAAPIRMLDLELSKPVSGELNLESCTRLAVLARLHGCPLGSVHLRAEADSVDLVQVRSQVLLSLDRVVGQHLRQDRISEVGEAPRTGRSRHRCLDDLHPVGPAPFVTVVIPTRNRSQQLASCLESVVSVDYDDFEILVVDNAPEDESTVELVRERYGREPRVRYVRQSRAGASLARNTGARLGRGDIVAFTDDDALVDPMWLRALVSGFSASPEVACVTGLTLPSALETPAQQAFEDYGGMGLGFDVRLYDLTSNRADTRLYPYTAGIFGASNNVAFRRREFLSRGGFDTTIGPGTPVFGAEDLDIFLEFILAEMKICYMPCATVRHEHRAQFPDLYWQVFTYSAGMTALLTKWAVNNRGVRRDLARRVPAIIPAAIFGRHRDGDTSDAAYLAQLRWLERAGYVYGPIAYVLSRLACRHREIPA